MAVLQVNDNVLVCISCEFEERENEEILNI